jgi:hypothetical protein
MARLDARSCLQALLRVGWINAPSTNMVQDVGARLWLTIMVLSLLKETSIVQNE